MGKKSARDHKKKEIAGETGKKMAKMREIQMCKKSGVRPGGGLYTTPVSPQGGGRGIYFGRGVSAPGKKKMLHAIK